jgi:hypothetical protein
MGGDADWTAFGGYLHPVGACSVTTPDDVEAKERTKAVTPNPVRIGGISSGYIEWKRKIKMSVGS